MSKEAKTAPVLDKLLLKLILRRLFLPLLLVSLVVVGGAGYMGRKALEGHQRQMVAAMAQMAEQHLDQGCRILDAVVRTAESSSPQLLESFMRSTWEAYGHFETLYYLDDQDRIERLIPYDPRYLGVDMSRLPQFQQTVLRGNSGISRPFVSLRTGNPTVYIMQPLSNGGRIVGALNLGNIQREVIEKNQKQDTDTAFILDQSGTLLAHPSVEWVKQQVNCSNWEIFQRGLQGPSTLIYDYEGTLVLGSAARVEGAGWVVVDQMPLQALLASYFWLLGWILLASLLFWLVLVWNLRRYLYRWVVKPLIRLRVGVNALTAGDFQQVALLSAEKGMFAEVSQLARDFHHMGTVLQARQKQLQESEEKYYKVFRYAADIIAIVRRRDRVYVEVNDAFCKITGYSREDIVGHTTDECNFWAGGEERQRVRQLIEERGSFHNEEAGVQTKDGLLKTGLLSVDLIVFSGERNDLLVWHDISERILAERDLRQARDELEQKVEMRTGELTAANQELMAINQELEQALAQLKRTQEHLVRSEKLAALGSLVAGVAHEINTPVGVCITTASYLDGIVRRMDRLYEQNLVQSAEYEECIGDCREAAGIMLTNSQQAARLISTFKQVSSSQLEEKSRIFGVKDCLEEILLAMQPRLRSTKHGVSIRCDENLHINGYPTVLAQILTNLLQNSLDHAYKPGEAGHIEIAVTVNPGEQMVLAYQDDGQGMYQEVKGRIYDPFFTTRRGTGATGLGMYLVYNLVVNQFDGAIACESKPGEGTRFIMVFPLRPDAFSDGQMVLDSEAEGRK